MASVAGGAGGALATGASVGEAGSAVMGPAEGGVGQSPESKPATIAEPATANIHQRAECMGRFTRPSDAGPSGCIALSLPNLGSELGH